VLERNQDVAYPLPLAVIIGLLTLFFARNDLKSNIQVTSPAESDWSGGGKNWRGFVECTR
jgi:hypothetical protein